MRSSFVPGFRPSAAGLQFGNQFPPGPVLYIRLPWLGRIGVGNSARGLCGGMVLAVRDLFLARLSPLPDTTPPAPGTPLFQYLVRRQLDSFQIPWGLLRYLGWMALPDQDSPTRHGIGYRTVVDEWPRVQSQIDAGLPAPLGLIRTRTTTPLAVWRIAANHQVLAYGYQLNPATQELTLWVYDPNYPDRDDVALTLPLGQPQGPVTMHYSTGEFLRGFFYTESRAVDPRSALAEGPPAPARVRD